MGRPGPSRVPAWSKVYEAQGSVVVRGSTDSIEYLSRKSAETWSDWPMYRTDFHAKSLR